MANHNSSATDVACLMKDDLALTTRVLRVANSAAFSGTTKVTSVAQAVARLGFKQTADVIKALSLVNLFKGSGMVDYKKFWRHSLSVAAATELIPRHLGRMAQTPESLYSAGLLHDVGIFVMEQYGGDLYHSVLSMALDTEVPLHVAERNMMDIDHAEVGALLLTKWGIPQDLITATGQHHQPYIPAPGGMTTSAVVNLANMVCTDLGIDNGVGTNPEKHSIEKWQEYGLPHDEIPVLATNINRLVERSASILES
jgi:putative nucleotidyltransferase with HDIG domain